VLASSRILLNCDEEERREKIEECSTTQHTRLSHHHKKKESHAVSFIQLVLRLTQKEIKIAETAQLI
jgi:tryptophanyl-tRNA synthetase